MRRFGSKINKQFSTYSKCQFYEILNTTSFYFIVRVHIHKVADIKYMFTLEHMGSVIRGTVSHMQVMFVVKSSWTPHFTICPSSWKQPLCVFLLIWPALALFQQTLQRQWQPIRIKSCQVEQMQGVLLGLCAGEI